MSIRNLKGFFRPVRNIIIGAPASPAALALCDSLRRDTPPAMLASSVEELPATGPSLAVIADPMAVTAATVAALAARGCQSLIWPGSTPPPAPVLEQARHHLTRILGPRSVGVESRSGQVHAIPLPASQMPGTLALIAQSQSVAAAAMDWARGRNVGFSWVAVTGGEVDVDIADLLDYAALDPGSRAVAIEVGSIRSARKFMSAARACARSKPVVVLQTRPAASGGRSPDPVRSAAFARAGMVECHSLPGLFDALAALHRLADVRHGTVMVVANGSGICALGAEAVMRQGLQPASPEPAVTDRVRQLVPQLRTGEGVADIGDLPLEVTLAALHEYLGDRSIDAVIFLHAPLPGASHLALARALVEARPGPRLATVWLGLESALPARQVCVEADLSTFTSPDAAARALRFRWEYRRNRELLTQTPRPEAENGPEARDTAAWLAQKAAGGPVELGGPGATQLLGRYGLHSAALRRHEGLSLEVALEQHVELGLHMRITPQLRGFRSASGYAFLPLDELLVRRMMHDAGLDCSVDGLPPEELERLSALLVRVGRIGLEQPAIAAMTLRVFWRHFGFFCDRKFSHLHITPDPLVERSRLALAPYPASEIHGIDCDGGHFSVRPVRPDDEPAVIRLLEGLDPESVRLRFFGAIRHFSHEMAARMTQIDYDRELALVILPANAPDRIVAMGTLVADPDGAAAEFAVLVDGEHHSLGLGQHMLERFLEHARQRGIGTVFGEVLAENGPMLHLARKLGMTTRACDDDPGCIHVEVSLRRDSARIT